MTQADAVHVNLALTKVSLSRALSASLFPVANRIGAQDFRAGLRFFLNLPQVTKFGNGFLSPKSGCLVDLCMCGNGSSELDPAGVHARSKCPTTKGRACGLHRRTTAALHDSAQVTGCHSVKEPPMTRVLLDEYSHAECMAMLPKAPSAASNARAIRIAIIKKDMPNAPPGVKPTLLAERAALTSLTPEHDRESRPAPAAGPSGRAAAIQAAAAEQRRRSET